jgi:hypothetical protein
MVTLARLLLSLAAALALVGHSATRLPSSVGTVDVHSSHGISRLVTDPVKVGRIVRWFDALPVDRARGEFDCPFIRANSPSVTFAFRAANGNLLARARVLDAFRGVSGPCNPIRFSVAGARPQLLLGGRFLLRVQRLLGIRFR